MVTHGGTGFDDLEEGTADQHWTLAEVMANIDLAEEARLRLEEAERALRQRDRRRSGPTARSRREQRRRR